VEECGGEPSIIKDSFLLEEFSHIILPGVGSFAKAMKNLKEKGFDTILKKQVIEKKIPFLGICLGMQVLAKEGQEGKSDNT
jgi:glutamine amidotransferase